MTENQMTIDEGIAAAIAARDEAIDRVEKNADAEWMQAAHLTICLTAEAYTHFSSDDIWLELSSLFPAYTTAEPRAMGAAMRRAAKEKIIRPTDEYIKSSRPECHRRPVMVWESLIYEED